MNGLHAPATGEAPRLTRETTRGVCRHLADLGYAVLTEVPLVNGRRADVLALDPEGRFAIVEVKVTVSDLAADTKWPDYEPFCDRLYFAVPTGFPHELVPGEAGLFVADAWNAEELRPAPETGLHASRRKALTLRFARLAAERHQRLIDPRL